MEIHVCASLHIYVYTHTHVLACICACICVRVYVDMYVCTCKCIGVQVKGYVGMSGGMQVYAQIHADMLDSALRVWVQWWGSFE